MRTVVAKVVGHSVVSAVEQLTDGKLDKPAHLAIAVRTARDRVPIIADGRAVRQRDLAVEESVPSEQPTRHDVFVVELLGVRSGATQEAASLLADLAHEPINTECDDP